MQRPRHLAARRAVRARVDEREGALDRVGREDEIAGRIFRRELPVEIEADLVDGGVEFGAVAVNGSLTVEVRNEQGKPQPGFTFADCDIFDGDSVSHTVSWRSQSDVSRFRGKAIQLAFRLKNAQFHAFK